MNILIADDHPTNLKLLRVQLEAQGMTVREAADGLQALAALESEPVDVVISDVLMPNMDGYQLCHTMRNSARFNAIPCILYSNTFDSESCRELGLQFGADLFLKKPAPMPAILAALGEVVRKGRREPPTGRAATPESGQAQPHGEDLVRELERQNAQNESTKRRLLEVNHKLLSRSKRLEKAESELREVNEQLERRVRERTAELKVANDELEAFSYSVSHDLRAPVRAIRGFSEIVLRKAGGQLDADSRASLERVVTAGRQMSGLIDGLLGLARITRTDIRRRSIDLSALAQSVLGELRQADPGRTIAIVVQPTGRVEGDAELLRIALTNLLCNAWKFTRKTAAPRIEFGASESAGQRTYFVRDNGAGFDPAYADRLFGAFQRLHSFAEFEGTGIGLATVQRIIQRHGGKIWAEGAPRQGATFFFTLGNETG